MESVAAGQAGAGRLVTRYFDTREEADRFAATRLGAFVARDPWGGYGWMVVFPA